MESLGLICHRKSKLPGLPCICIERVFLPELRVHLWDNWTIWVCALQRPEQDKVRIPAVNVRRSIYKGQLAWLVEKPDTDVKRQRNRHCPTLKTYIISGHSWCRNLQSERPICDWIPNSIRKTADYDCVDYLRFLFLHNTVESAFVGSD